MPGSGPALLSNQDATDECRPLRPVAAGLRWVVQSHHRKQTRIFGELGLPEIAFSYAMLRNEPPCTTLCARVRAKTSWR